MFYEYSNAMHALDMSKHQRKRYIKSFTAIWILLCVLLITAWCIVNFVLDLRLYEHSSVIKNYVMLFVILGVVILIAVLTVFGLWGVFMRMISKTYRPHDPEARRSMETLQSELQTADKYKSRENALRIFDDRIVIVTKGKEQVIDKNELTACSMIRSRAGLFLVFYRANTERISVPCMPPAADAYLIKKCLGDMLEEIKIPKGKKSGKAKKGNERAEKPTCDTAASTALKRSDENADRVQIETGALFAGILCTVLGVMIVLLGYYRVMGDMPAIVGGFPIGIGLLFVVLAFYRYEIVSVFLLKLFVAALFIFMGLLFLIVIEEGVTKSPVTVQSLLRHPTVYAIVCLFFVSVGISFIPNAVKSLVEYIRYR